METEIFISDESQEQEEYTEIFETVISDIVSSETVSTEETIPDATSEIIFIEETTISEETSATETTINYLSEIAENTRITAQCSSYLSGLSVIIIAVLICSVIIKVFFGGHNL